LSMAREKKLSEPDQPYDLFFPDTVKDLLARIKKKDKTLYEQLRKRFKKLRKNPECGEILSHDKAGYREVHIKGHWVIIYCADYDTHTIVIVKIGIHDSVLGR
jgi:addiction module RelE/StbE family toxin